MRKAFYELNNNGFAVGEYGGQRENTIMLPKCPGDEYYWDFEKKAWLHSSQKELEKEISKIQELRANAYPPLGDMAGALYDYFLQKKLNQEELPDELNQWVSDCTKVKSDFPKPEIEEV